MKIERIKNIIQVSEEIGSDIAKIVAYDKIKEIINENDRGFTVEAIPSAKHETKQDV